MSLPDQRPTELVGQPVLESTPLTDAVIEAAVRDALHQTSYRDNTPVPKIGDAPPVAQPGRPPMSQGATDASALMLAGGAATAMVGGTAAVVMYVSQFADPVVCALVFGAPTALALALARLLGRAKGVLPDEIHNYYSGPVHQDQRNVDHHNRWFGKSTTNL